MNPLRHVDWDWFWGVLVALMLVLLVYLYATRPPLRPTERVESEREQISE